MFMQYVDVRNLTSEDVIQLMQQSGTTLVLRVRTLTPVDIDIVRIPSIDVPRGLTKWSLYCSLMTAFR